MTPSADAVRGRPEAEVLERKPQGNPRGAAASAGAWIRRRRVRINAT